MDELQVCLQKVTHVRLSDRSKLMKSGQDYRQGSETFISKKKRIKKSSQNHFITTRFCRIQFFRNPSPSRFMLC